MKHKERVALAGGANPASASVDMLARIEEYMGEAKSGFVNKGMRGLLPFVHRHFYIFHKVNPGTELRSLLKSNRKLFYQVPYSEYHHNPEWVGLIAADIGRHKAKSKQRDGQETLDWWKYDLGNNELVDAINNALSSSCYDIDFDHTRAVHNVLAAGSPGTKSFADFQRGYQYERVVPFLSRRPDGYKSELFDVERSLYQDASSADISIRHYPLSHLGIWFGLLILFVDAQALADGEQQFDAQVGIVSPWISLKMYRFVVERRFGTRLLENSDAWSVEQLSRVAATAGLNRVAVSRRRHRIMFYRKKRERRTDLLVDMHFSSGAWSIKYKVARDYDAYISRALEETKLEARTYYGLRQSEERTATAAVMSRNMSHNLGSHALANSKFFESVGLLDLGEGDRPEVLLRDVTKGQVKGARNRLQAFNQYCQGRLDFIARKLSIEKADKPEPMFLVNDVIKGFMTQQVLLNTLLDDNGFRIMNFKFYIHSGGKCDKWEWVTSPEQSDKKRIELRSPEPQTAEDVLVGMVGGVTGCHALYALIENLLRNAAKYSKRQWRDQEEPELQVHIEFTPVKIRDKECYSLRLWENLTHDAEGTIASRVREGLSKSILDRKGGHGLTEMRICAEYLAAGLSFQESDPKGQTGAGTDESEFSDKPALRAYRATHRFESVFKGNEKEVDQRQSLIYELLLPNPVLLGFVCARTVGESVGSGAVCQPLDPCVRQFADLAEMSATSPHCGMILAHDDDRECRRRVLTDIAKYHTALPYRLLVVTPNEEGAEVWRAAIENASANAVQSRWYPGASRELASAIAAFNPEVKGVPIIPFRRVHVVSLPTFLSRLCDTDWKRQYGVVGRGSCCSSIGSVKKDEWRRLVLEIYSSWIRVWKGEPPAGNERWKLLVGFQRDFDQVSARWSSSIRTICPENSGVWESRDRAHLGGNLFDVYVVAKAKGHDSPSVVAARVGGAFRECGSGADVVLPRDLSCCLVFDNHNEVFDEDYRYARFYHNFGAATLTLFQHLETPPTDWFACGFFLFSLLEACLTNIYVLDERVADSTIKDGMLEGERYRGLLKSGIHPLYSFDRGSVNCDITESDDVAVGRALVERRFITPNLREALVSTYKKKLICWRVIAAEGVRFKADGRVEIRQMSSEEPIADEPFMAFDPNTLTDSIPDVIIIHEGIVDSLYDHMPDRLWEEKDHWRLYSVMPAVLRTSGRGGKPRHLGNALPFLELNVLSDSCYGSPNKVKLAKAALACAGGVENLE